MSDNKRGQIITFYSYKGGTGRSMALANVACLLAQRQPSSGKGVLMLDWDLEAPGLHRYFRDRRLQPGAEDPSDDKPGLIDLFYEIDRRTDSILSISERIKLTTGDDPQSVKMDSEEMARAVLDAIKLDDYILKTEVSSLYLLKAGRFERKNPETYSARVNTFDWEALYQKSPKLIRVLAERLAETYQYVLIDSRTGITDISGICTMLLPEKLVVVFTPNRQSILGGLKLIERATEYRRESSDLRPLVVFPLVSRVEANEPMLREEWRFGSKDVTGYQPEFEKVLKEVYGLKDVSLKHYFDEMQIQHIPRYAYGEEIAVLAEKIEDKFSLKRSYNTFAAKLVESRAPWAKDGEVTETVKHEEPNFFGRLWERVRLLPRLLGDPWTTAIALGIAAVSLWFVYSSNNISKDATVKLQQEKQLSEQMRAQLDDANRKLQEVSSYTTVLDQNKKTIDDLNKQFADASAERDKARQEAADMSTQLSLSQSALQSARTQLESANVSAKIAQVALAQQREAGRDMSLKYQNLLSRCRTGIDP